jgi:lysozyme family protein
MVYLYNAQRAAQLARRWDSMVITRQRTVIEYEAKEIIKHRALYEQAQIHTGVPWWMIGVIDDREGGVSHLGQRQLGQGDSLNSYSRHVPAGRPHVGHGPPFTWLECAIDALKLEGLHQIGLEHFTIERALHALEPYNGLGYYQMGRPSPYIWSCTTIYDPPHGPGGKYIADHVFSSRAVDPQCGCAPILQRIEALTGVHFPREVEHKPVPIDDDSDIVWLQTSLNTLGADPPLKVDGDNGPNTRHAVADFQQAHPPLRVDGINGPNTRAMIQEQLARKVAPK